MSDIMYEVGISLMQASRSQAKNAAANLGRAGIEGATAHRVTKVANALDGNIAGVGITKSTRIVDDMSMAKLREQAGILEKHLTQTTYLQQLQQSFGSPSDTNSLGEMIIEIKNCLDRIKGDPTNSIHKDGLIFVAQNLARDIQSVSNRVQFLRQKAEDEIAASIQIINEQLAIIEESNHRIGENSVTGLSTANDEDIRDEALQTLSKYMDFIIVPGDRGRINVKVPNGAPLINAIGKRNQVNYTPRSGFSATVTYPNDLGEITISSAGTNPLNITQGIGSGKIAALRDLRDTHLPHFQKELDEFTVKLRNEFNSIHNLGTGWPAPDSLTGTRRFANPTTDAYTFTGTLRVALIDNSEANGIFNNIYDLDFSALPGGGILTANDFKDLINSASINITASITTDGNLKLQSTHPGFGIAMTSLSTPPAQVNETGQQISDFFGLNDFWVTGHHFNGDGVTTGLAEMLSIREDISNNPPLIATHLLSNKPTVALGAEAIAGRGAVNSESLKNLFDTQILFAAAGNLPAKTVTIVDYANSILSDVVANTKRLDSLYKREASIFEILKKNAYAFSGIDEQGQLVDIMNAQKSYSYAAAIIKSAKEMDEILLSLKR